MNKLALVTGASAGIGFHLAEGLVQRGFTVVGVGASDRILTLPERIGRGTVIPLRADLASREGVAEVWEKVESIGEPLDVAVLNAGVTLGGAFVDTDVEQELRMLSLNVTSQVLLAKDVTRQMVAQGQGRILITSSLSALTPTPYESIYGPTRAFMFSFAEGLREELREQGVSVTALLPGATATEFHNRGGMQNTGFGDNSGKADPRLVADIGLDGLFAGRDHVIGGSRRTKVSAWRNKFRSEVSKARRFAERSQPRDI